MFAVRGIVFSYEAVREWEAKLTPALAEDLRRRRRGQVGRSWYVDETEILSANSLDRAGWAWAPGRSGVAERYEGGQQQDRSAPRLDRRPLPSSPPNSPTVSTSHLHTNCGPPCRAGAAVDLRPGRG